MFEKLNQVVPLGDRRILKLIDEEVAVPVADALVDERRGIVADNGGDFPVEGGQQAHVFFPLHSSEFIADQTEGADQAHALLQVLFEFELPPRFPFIEVTPRLCSLFDGWNGILNACCGGSGRFGRPKHRLLQLTREAFADGGLASGPVGYAPKPLGQVSVAEVSLLQVQRLDSSRGGFGRLNGCCASFAQAFALGFAEPFQGLGRPLSGVQRLQRCLHVFLRDLLAERLQLVANDGVFFLLYLLSHEAFKHGRQRFFLRTTHPAEQPGNRLVQERFLVQFDLKVLLPLQILAEAADQPVDKTVDGHDTEVLVPVHHGLAQGTRPSFQFLRCNGDDFKQRPVHGTLPLRHLTDVAQDALLHLLRGKVGEGDGEDVFEVMRVVFPQAACEVIAHQTVGFARSSARFDHVKPLLCILDLHFYVIVSAVQRLPKLDVIPLRNNARSPCISALISLFLACSSWSSPAAIGATLSRQSPRREQRR